MLLNKQTTPIESCELKFAQDRPGVFEGYASVWGRVDSYGDTVVKGAFNKTLEARERAPLMLFGHSPGRVIGKWLKLEEDDYGLKAVGELTPGHTDAQNVHASMKHGAISGLSIGFRLPEGGAEEKEDGRILKEIDLVEISVVTFPAEDAARISNVKGEIESLESLKDAERWLRDAAAFSRTDAKALLSQLRGLFQRDAEEDQERIKALEAEARKTEDGQWLAETINKHFGRLIR